MLEQQKCLVQFLSKNQVDFFGDITNNDVHMLPHFKNTNENLKSKLKNRIECNMMWLENSFEIFWQKYIRRK